MQDPQLISKTWILDSGATSHLYSHDDRLIDLDSNVSGIKVADGFPAPIKGKGTVSLRCKFENQYNELTAKDVLFIPSVQENVGVYLL